MKKPEIIKVEVLNWTKWNPKPEKTTNNFKLSNTFFEDPKIQSLNKSEILLLLFIFTRAAQQKTDQPQFMASSLAVHLKFRGSSLADGLSKLSELGIVKIHKERNKERKKAIKSHPIKKEKIPKPDPGYPDYFEDLWKRWPRADGDAPPKAQSWKNLQAFMKAHSKEKAVRCAENYIQYQKDRDSIPYRLSNFFGKKEYWRDFTEPVKTGPKKKEWPKEMLDEMREYSFDD